MERGYVLHTRPFRESSVLVNLLVDGKGRVDAVARLGGAKNSIRSIVQPFQPIIFQLQGKSDLKNLKQVEAASPAVPLSGDCLYSGLYLNELLIRCLTVQHSAEDLFFNYHQTLIAMAKGFDQIQLRYFELALLQELGTMPSLENDPSGAFITASGFYRLDMEHGFMPVVATAFNQHKFFTGAMLVALKDQSLSAQHSTEAKKLMRQLLAPTLGDKPLHSRSLFIKKRANSGNTVRKG
ncbi:DNA repair protein RecO [Shewanella sp. Choline-02u-19]|uniref:DNA repair protein RecO n=1 Tax=unclassified Shewanella TaxID=196818 RepID=UPI000C34FDBC|nr:MULTISPECIES: DNA repair protein RecO [unclassified Shewanella]PKG57224.1 DNA repair protein RecO [Shewanella sp. GutDb-MelDb]PKG76462.1 DNA repair protein RecO [Shewanella sp. GutCb]PKH57584.1 DNA repair protein RecO [Shewanella sp. Bg11-22]PKI28445.1 DNA repair protein RecO [Shewanella sp. Choline-02u-19]